MINSNLSKVTRAVSGMDNLVNNELWFFFSFKKMGCVVPQWVCTAFSFDWGFMSSGSWHRLAHADQELWSAVIAVCALKKSRNKVFRVCSKANPSHNKAHRWKMTQWSQDKWAPLESRGVEVTVTLGASLWTAEIWVCHLGDRNYKFCRLYSYDEKHEMIYKMLALAWRTVRSPQVNIVTLFLWENGRTLQSS